MAAKTYQACLDVTLREEGGYSNHPKDPGGATMKGVTQRVYDAYRDRKGVARQGVRDIARAELEEIYRRQYWDAVKGDDLPAGLDLVVFDFAVNSGPSRAIKTLQQALGVTADGALGEVTLARLAAIPDVEGIVAAVSSLRLAFLKRLSTWGTFGRGWSARVSRVRKAAEDLIDGVPVARLADHAIMAEDTAKGLDSDQAMTASATGKGAVVGGIGAAGTVLTQAAQQISGLGELGDVFKWICAALVVAGVAFTVYGTLKGAKSPEAQE